MLARVKTRDRILAHRDATVLQYGLNARPQEIWGIRWMWVTETFADIMEVISWGELDEYGKTSSPTPAQAPYTSASTSARSGRKVFNPAVAKARGVDTTAFSGSDSGQERTLAKQYKAWRSEANGRERERTAPKPGFTATSWQNCTCDYSALRGPRNVPPGAPSGTDLAYGSGLDRSGSPCCTMCIGCTLRASTCTCGVHTGSKSAARFAEKPVSKPNLYGRPDTKKSHESQRTRAKQPENAGGCATRFASVRVTVRVAARGSGLAVAGS
jgi:hypothetical protein